MNMQHEHDMYRIPLPTAPGSTLSEFNHHLAGVFVLLLGISAILMYVWPERMKFLKFVWPASLLMLGAYLLVYSDPEYWPSGYASFAETMGDPESRQHKIYALLLFVIGSVELLRTTSVLKNDRWKYAFPVLAGLGALYLIAHEFIKSGGHQSHMNGSHTSSSLVMYQHILYIVLGVGLAANKALYDAGKLRFRAARYIWPSLMIGLGIALILYRE